jgi:hypothetical protein
VAAAVRPPAVAPTPLYHIIAYLQGHAVIIDLRAARPNLSREERNSFLLRDLGINPADITDVFMVPSTQLLRVGFHAEGPCSAALVKLQVGVPWAAADGALVYGWSPADSLFRVRVSGCTPTLTPTGWRPTWPSLAEWFSPLEEWTAPLVTSSMVSSTSPSS